MNPLFTNLTQETLAYLEDQLSNNDVAGDDELIDLFIEELSLTWSRRKRLSRYAISTSARSS